MVTGATIDENVFALGCCEAFNRYHALLHVRDRMPLMTLEENAKYADLVIRTYGRDEEFATEQLSYLKLLPKVDASKITASVIGALAFFALHAPTDDLRETALQAHNKMNVSTTILRAASCNISMFLSSLLCGRYIYTFPFKIEKIPH